MKKFFFLLLVACALSTALPVIALSAESQADTATENSDSEVFVDDSGRFTAFEEELLARYAACGGGSAMQIAAHFANIIRVSEAVVVRERAGRALLGIAPRLTSEERNEVAVELAKALEAGHYEFSKYIPQYLGSFMLWLPPAAATRSFSC